MLTRALVLALGAMVSLGLARFSYALLLPPMRADLGWSYFVAGSMNTVNAAGYLAGAMAMPWLLARLQARTLLLAGSAGAALALCGHGLVTGDAALLVLRALTGLASAAAFVAGGLLAAQLAQGGGAALAAGGESAGDAQGGAAGHAAHAAGHAAGHASDGAGNGAADGAVKPGLVLGIYYGGTGLGIVAAALLAPPLLARAQPHAWQGAWFALGAAALAATAVMAAATRGRDATAPRAAASAAPFRWRSLGWGLGGYFLFGLGYIGYMTFVVTLLHEQGLAAATVTAFYVLLGLAVMASSRVWAGLLQRHRDGTPLAWLNGLLAIATLLPVLSAHPVAVFASGALFGGVFLSVVAATTALVRHNVPATAWPAGITAFTIVFAAGQIVGPGLVGWLADGGGLAHGRGLAPAGGLADAGGLARGLAVSAGVLAPGAVLASRQRALPAP